MEWNGDPMWWQDGIQLQQQSVNPCPSPASPAYVARATASCPRTPTTAAPTTPAVCAGYPAASVVTPPAVASNRFLPVPAAPPAAAAPAPAPAQAPAQAPAPQAADNRPTPDSSKPDKQAAKVSKLASQPVTKQQLGWFEFLPLQASVKPTLRPKYPCSQKNISSIDRQAAKEQQDADARAARYMQQAATLVCHNHHKTLQLGPAGAVPEQHIVMGDKGKHRPSWCRSGFLYDPITSTSRPVTAPGRTESCAGLLSPQKGSILRGTLGEQDGSSDSAGGLRDSTSGRGDETFFFAGSSYHTHNGELIALQSRPGTASGTQGRYNPITHTWAEQPEAAAYEKWQRETDRPATAPYRRTSSEIASSTRELAGKDTVRSLLTKQSSNGIGIVSDTARPASAGGRRHVRSGDTWGTYDVLRNEWVVPPADPRYANREMNPCSRRTESVSAEGGAIKPMRRAVVPPSTGVYDPIKCEWKVLPEKWRAACTLDFSPTKLFQEKAFVKR